MIHELKNRVVDVLGMVVIGHATITNLWEVITGINYNAIFLIVTSVLSIVFLCYRIRETRRSSQLRKLEIDKHMLELERISIEIRKISKE